MNFVDLILAICLLWAAAKGWRIGLLQSLVILIGLVLAYGFALSYGGEVAGRIAGDPAESGSESTLIGFLVVFLLTLFACYLAGRILHKALRVSPFGIFDAIGGGGIGLANALLILGLLTILLHAHPLHSKLPGFIDGSALGRPVQRAALLLLDGVKAVVPRTTHLYKQLVPETMTLDPHPIVDEMSDQADAARAKLDSLIKESRKRLDSKQE